MNPACDCGALKAKTTHANWCSVLKPLGEPEFDFADLDLIPLGDGYTILVYPPNGDLEEELTPTNP